METLITLQKLLIKSGYQDSIRISKEILAFCDSDQEKLENVMSRIEAGEPWEYIRGSAQFMDLTFSVNRSVLIPRIESEKIVELMHSRFVWYLNRGYTPFYIDVGTGSGCLLISLINMLQENNHGDPSSRFVGIDISPEALEVAKSNGQAILGSTKKFTPIQSDLLDSEQLINDLTDFREEKDKAALLISANLPYIKPDDFEQLDRSVKDFEPKIALYDSDPLGIGTILRLLEQFDSIKMPKSIVLEVDPSQVAVLREQRQDSNLSFSIEPDCFNRERFIILEDELFK